MSNNKYYPTSSLRWKFASDKEEELPCATNTRGYSYTPYILQQLWKDDNGNEIWVNVEIQD